MNCYRCHTEHEAGTHYCKQCGADLWDVPAYRDDGSRRTLMHVLILIGWEYFVYVIWIVIQRLVMMRHSYGSGIRSMSTLFTTMRWVLGGIEMVLMIVFAVLAQNKTARICLIVFAVLRLMLLISYSS